MAKAWHFSHYKLNDQNEFVLIDTVTTHVKKAGFRPIGEREDGVPYFHVVKDLSTGFISIEQFTGSCNDAERLKKMLIDGADPREAPDYATSCFSVVENGEYPNGHTLLLQSPRPLAPAEWKALRLEATARFQEIEAMSPQERFRLPQKEQTAFGMYLPNYMSYYLEERHGITAPAFTRACQTY